MFGIVDFRAGFIFSAPQGSLWHYVSNCLNFCRENCQFFFNIAKFKKNLKNFGEKNVEKTMQILKTNFIQEYNFQIIIQTNFLKDNQ